MHDANIGDVKEVTDFEANILIKTGVANKFGKQSNSDKPADEQPEDVKE